MALTPSQGVLSLKLSKRVLAARSDSAVELLAALSRAIGLQRAPIASEQQQSARE